MVLRKSFYIRWSAGRSPRVHEVNPGRDPSIFPSKNGHFFNINGACKVIVVDTIHEIVIKTRKTSANNRSFFIYQEPTAKYFLKLKYVLLGLWKLRKTYYEHLFSGFLSQHHVLYKHQ